ncbi:pyridoxal kinase PdxY [Pelagibius litoralis]|uniref:pyridoxal kinase n=1 Tax=Pelagibius litoralis TaxID=374515 RepID=A0A967EX85_9PROT|nr:pyridoxal kinase PdxY [Pelagibius litoralis]NIA68240.1 pyridoxal kinase PdxY [Pelagibius litoralis]
MNVISIQSHVAYGHVGNAAAVFLLQRLGFEVWPVHTVQFSNHTGYGDWQGDVFKADHIAALIDGLEARGALARCDALLSGYVGDAALGDAILDAAARIRAANPKAVYLCDPVMGDQGTGLFVRDGVPEFMRERALPTADFLTPNLFELEILSGRKLTNEGETLQAARELLLQGPRAILVTSLEQADDDTTMAMLAVTTEGSWRVTCPRLPTHPLTSGAGDSVAALFLGHLLKTASVPDALAAAAAGIYEVLRSTLESGEQELQLIAAQERLLTPRERFTVEQIS